MPPRLPVFSPETTDPRAFLIYEDAHVLAFDKPAGLSVQGGGGVEANLDDLLVAFARSNGKRPRLAHRLDRETSGVIVAGRTHPALTFLNRAFSERTTVKHYLAIVCGGAPDPDSGVIGNALMRTKVRGIDLVRAARDGEAAAQTASTSYRTLAASSDAALVEASPHTGRMHQIRAHLAQTGRPIAGDGKYGGLFAIGAVATPYLMLHALALDAPHPDGGRVHIAAAPPPAFCAAAARLGLEAGMPHIRSGGERRPLDGASST